MRKEETYDKMFNIVATTRKTGYTTAMLRASMYQPNCIIVGGSEQIARGIERQYDVLYHQIFKPKNIYKRLLIKTYIWLGVLNKPTQKPMFVSINRDLRGIQKTVFFDNSCFLS